MSDQPCQVPPLCGPVAPSVVPTASPVEIVVPGWFVAGLCAMVLTFVGLVLLALLGMVRKLGEGMVQRALERRLSPRKRR